jgi:hypothetical protein
VIKNSQDMTKEKQGEGRGKFWSAIDNYNATDSKAIDFGKDRKKQAKGTE